MRLPPIAGAPARRRYLRPAALTAVIFFSVSGGPYGLEPVLNLAGGRGSLLLVFLAPVIWALPVMLMVFELNAMMPRNGGYYQWVKAGLGPMWGFFEGWWTWLYMLTDLAIYPVLFVEYTAFFFPAPSGFSWPFCLAVIWLCAGVNLRGILPVGRSSVAFGTVVMIPFLLLFGAAFRHGVSLPGANPGLHTAPAMGLGLFTVMWNYLGWDNPTTFAEEVDRPAHAYLASSCQAFGLIFCLYALSIMAATVSGIDPGVLEKEGFPSLGLRLGGPLLGGLIASGGMASALGLFVAGLLSVSRLPKAMSDDGLLPPIFRITSKGSGTPSGSILLCALAVSGMALWHFEDLIIIDVFLYGCALFLEFLALIRLRTRMPALDRPFRIPLGKGGLIAMTSLPAICFLAGIAGLALTGGIHFLALIFGIVALSTAPIAWKATSRHRAAPMSP